MRVLRIAVARQVERGERRVALTPAAAGRLADDGHEIRVEHGAGARAGFTDDAYREAGAEVCDRAEALEASEIVCVVTGPPDPDHSPAEPTLWSLLGPDHVLVGVQDSLWRPERAAKLATTGATVFGLDLMPRITRAQSMDVLSSMATVAGYEAALLAASRLPKLLPLLMTAAGTVPATRVLVLGAGVAGLQAIATARRLGAIVEGYDIRPAATEQIASLGARPIGPAPSEADDAETEGGYARAQTSDDAEAQHRLLAEHVADADAVITTAAVPGRRSPVLVTASMVEAMAAGSVVIDLAAERGGNCELTVADTEIDHGGVAILGPTDLPSRAPVTASSLFAGNVTAFLRHLAPDGELVVDTDDEITAATLVATGGEVVPPTLEPT